MTSWSGKQDNEVKKDIFDPGRTVMSSRDFGVLEAPRARPA